MKRNELDSYIAIINTALHKSGVKINKWREKFMVEVLILYLMIAKAGTWTSCISFSGIKPDEEINRKLWEEGIKFAVIAA